MSIFHHSSDAWEWSVFCTSNLSPDLLNWNSTNLPNVESLRLVFQATCPPHPPVPTLGNEVFFAPQTWCNDHAPGQCFAKILRMGGYMNCAKIRKIGAVEFFFQLKFISTWMPPAWYFLLIWRNPLLLTYCFILMYLELYAKEPSSIAQGWDPGRI